MEEKIKNILDCFHHIHYSENSNEYIHHCGGKHKKINSKLDYKINHCSCKKHSINKNDAIGHVMNKEFRLVEIIIEFFEKCPNGGWHIESGKIKSKEKNLF